MSREIVWFEDRDEIAGIVGGWVKDSDFEIIKNEMTDQTRWAVIHEVILRRKSDGKFFFTTYSEGATESQDQSMYEYDEKKFSEVVPVEKTVIDYVWKEE